MKRLFLLIAVSGALAWAMPDSSRLPVLVESTQPQYSPAARAKKVEGTVVLTFTIALDGTPRDIVVVKKLHKDLDENAVTALSKWRFHPAEEDGKPVETKATISVSFKLKDHPHGLRRLWSGIPKFGI